MSEPSSLPSSLHQQPILSLVHPDKLEKKVRKKIVIVKNPNLKKQEASAAAAATTAATTAAAAPLHVDIYVILNHNKKYKPVLRELSRRTAWLQWLQKFDIVMRDFEDRAKLYVEHKEEKTAAAAAPAPTKKDTVIVIKKKKRKAPAASIAEGVVAEKA